MEILKEAGLDEIEKCLLRLGGGNHRDNMAALGGFRNHFLVRLVEDEFLGLVFLQNDEVLEICPRGLDRRLAAVAQRAIRTPRRSLTANWDLDSVLARTRESLKNEVRIGPLFLRDARGSELRDGLWYLQDGSHRALGYAMALASGIARFVPVEAYCATARDLI